MKIAVSTDHAGYDRLDALKKFLVVEGHEVIDFGPDKFDKNDDYPDFIRPAAEAVAAGDAEVGIIFGGSGQGEAMVANRVKGVRCGVYYGSSTAVEWIDAEGSPPTDGYDILRLNREHNHANMLSLAGRFLSQEEIEKAVRVWLGTEFSPEERHARRVKKIDDPGV